MIYSNNQAEYFALLQCLFRALRLQDPHVIFEVDSLILAKQLARHLLWACRSENLIALHQQCVRVCDSLSARHISWDIFVIFTVSSTRPQIHCLIRRSMSEIRMVFQHFGCAQFAHLVRGQAVKLSSELRSALEFFATAHSCCEQSVSVNSVVDGSVAR